MAATFYEPEPGEFVADFIERHRRLGPWKTQSVAALVFSPEYDKVALCFPNKVAEREQEDRIRVPLQGKLSGRAVHPTEGARKILSEKANLLLHIRDVHYLGFGYTRRFRAGETELVYHKRLHFVYCALAHERRLPQRSSYARHLDWYPVAAIRAIAEASMDERKAWLFFEALKRVAAEHTPYAPRLREAVS
jgi:hypothetical protein